MHRRVRVWAGKTVEYGPGCSRSKIKNFEISTLRVRGWWRERTVFAALKIYFSVCLLGGKGVRQSFFGAGRISMDVRAKRDLTVEDRY